MLFNCTFPGIIGNSFGFVTILKPCRNVHELGGTGISDEKWWRISSQITYDCPKYAFYLECFVQFEIFVAPLQREKNVQECPWISWNPVWCMKNGVRIYSSQVITPRLCVTGVILGASGIAYHNAAWIHYCRHPPLLTKIQSESITAGIYQDLVLGDLSPRVSVCTT